MIHYRPAFRARTGHWTGGFHLRPTNAERRPVNDSHSPMELITARNTPMEIVEEYHPKDTFHLKTIPAPSTNKKSQPIIKLTHKIYPPSCREIEECTPYSKPTLCLENRTAEPK